MRIELCNLIEAICGGRHRDAQDWEAYCARGLLQDDEEIVIYLKALFHAGYHTVARQRAATWCDDPKAVIQELEKLLPPRVALKLVAESREAVEEVMWSAE